MPADRGAPCGHHWTKLEVSQDGYGLYVLCSECNYRTRDLKNWFLPEDANDQGDTRS